MSIHNYRIMPSGKQVELKPTPKQNKYLLSIGASKVFGSDWNGYGYSNTNRVYNLTPSQVAKYNKIAKLATPSKPKKTYAEKVEAWCVRLSKLTGISIEVSRAIAQEKEEYKEEKIGEMIERNNERPSRQRDKLIRKMERENPLRPIKDKDHANAIIVASDRHNYTDYEDKLEEARELASIGEIDRGEIKQYARIHYAR